ncbi:hypothetical protein CPLU01_12716 [Colletotrichum plurivorum]|uniref:Uncharacterized protein n=1 Tax=Colletotrichum plurivorum TaxID=2175906 RepID=A0A8H6JWU1_9PEZI|nr:hypothetical protein CPLU01_12716 [Colletotrichum plurivorum]
MRVIETHFSPTVVAYARETIHQWNESEQSSISRVVDGYALRLDLVPIDVRARAPKSVDELIWAIGPIFNASTTTVRIAANIRGFNAIAGVQCSQVFLGHKTIDGWIMHIIEQLFIGVESLAVSDRTTMTQSSSAAGSMGPSSSMATTIDTPFDGAGDMFDVPDEKSIEQINLRGRTIVEGWTSNPATTRLSCLGRGQHLGHDPANLGPMWTPNTPGANYVYHGTASHYRFPGWIPMFNKTPFKALLPFPNPNQMSPMSIPGVFTAFSPLRAFLWSAFKDHLCSMTPSAEELGHMQQPWICDGQTYHGLVLFQFYGTQPSPDGLTNYTIPVGKEKAWGDLSSGGLTQGIATDDAWEHYTSIHGQGKGDWPDLLHGLEYEPQRSQLAPFRTNMWRTLWKGGKATVHLNSQHAATFAIHFDLSEAVRPPKPGPQADNTQKPKDDGDDGHGKGGKDKKGGMRKRLSKRVPTFFDAMRPSSQGSAR